jgi:hypothetical protein
LHAKFLEQLRLSGFGQQENREQPHART